MQRDKTDSTARLRAVLHCVSLLFVVIAVLEVAARMDDWIHYDAPLAENYEPERIVRHTDQGLRGVPHGRYLRWRLNGEGFRGPEIRPQAGQVRVAVLGASEAFGLHEDSDKEFPRVLENELNARDGQGRFEVVNASLPGTRIGPRAPQLAELASRLNVRVVVIYPTPSFYIGISRMQCGPSLSKVTTDASNWPRLRISGKIWETTKKVLPAAVLTLMRRASIAWQTRGRKPLERVSQESLAALEFELGCVVSTARAAGIAPLLVTHARRFENRPGPDDADRLTQWRQQYPILKESGFIDLEKRANSIIRDLARSAGVPLVDADASLSGHAALFADHAHFTNEGAAAMGALLAPAVAAVSRAHSR